MSTQSVHSVSSDSSYGKTPYRSVGQDPVEPVKVAVVQAEPSWYAHIPEKYQKYGNINCDVQV